jgi:hypothetical protein
LAPNLNKNFLEQIFRVGANLEHAHGQGKDQRGTAVVELAERLPILLGDLLD